MQVTYFHHIALWGFDFNNDSDLTFKDSFNKFTFDFGE